jgi:TolA-binding protein
LFNNHKSETKDTIKREIYELKRTTPIIKKKKLNKDLGKPHRKESNREILGRKSPYSQTKNTVEGHSRRLEQVEDRISELENEIEIKEKAEETLVKQFKSCERNMQELRNYQRTKTENNGCFRRRGINKRDMLHIQ